MLRALLPALLLLADVTPRGDPFRPETARMLAAVQLGKSPVASFAFARDARRLVVLSADGKLSLWDLPARREIRPVAGAFFNSRIALNGSGSLALGPSTDRRSVRLVDLERGVEVRSFADAQAAFPQAYAVSPDGRRVAYVRRDQAVLVCDASTGEELRTLIDPATGQCGAMAWSPDGKHLAIHGWDGAVRILDPRGGDVVATIADIGRGTHFIGYSPNSATLAVVTHESRIRLFDRAGKELASPTEIVGGSRFIAFSPDSALMAACEIGGKTRIWDTRTWRAVRDLESGLIRHLAFSPDGRHLVLGAMDGTLHLWGGSGGWGPPPKDEQPPRAGPSGFLGISADTADDEEAGVVISTVIAGTAAEKAGLKVGDRILRIGTTATDTFDTLRILIQSLREGDEVEVVYKRDGAENKVKLKLGARPAGE